MPIFGWEEDQYAWEVVKSVAGESLMVDPFMRYFIEFNLRDEFNGQVFNGEELVQSLRLQKSPVIKIVLYNCFYFGTIIKSIRESNTQTAV